MAYLQELEKNHTTYANVIEELIAQPHTNEQLVDLLKQVTIYLRASSNQLHTYNEYITNFMGVMNRLP